MARFFIILVLWLATCWSVVGSLLAPVVPGGWASVLGLVVLSTAPLVPLAALARARGGGHTPGAAVRVWILRPFVYGQLLLPLLAAAGLAGSLAGALVGRVGTGGRWALAVAASAFAWLVLVGYVESRRVVLTRVTVSWDDLPPALDGLRIAQISDTHVGPQTPARHLALIARLVLDARPDLVVVTGDLVDDHAEDVDAYAAGLGRLAAPLGMWAVPGNHDVYAGWAAVRARLAALPMTVLVNEWQWIEHRGARFVLLGTGDPAGRRGGNADAAAPDLDRAFAGVPRDALVIALAHNPALWPALAARGVRLTLSGHTHWGQLAIPGLGWSLASPFNAHAMGGYVERESVLYVHPGSNFWGIPFRLGTPPEVAIIELGTTLARPVPLRRRT